MGKYLRKTFSDVSAKMLSRVEKPETFDGTHEDFRNHIS
jgi:hypothetical protein